MLISSAASYPAAVAVKQFGRKHMVQSVRLLGGHTSGKCLTVEEVHEHTAVPHSSQELGIRRMRDLL